MKLLFIAIVISLFLTNTSGFDTFEDSGMVKNSVIKKEDGKYVLYTADGSRVLGKHDSRQAAIKQEYAIQKSKEKSSSYLYKQSENQHEQMYQTSPEFREAYWASRRRAEQVSKMFPGLDNDNARKLLHATAAVESNYGLHPNTYRRDYNGGIYQVDPIAYKATQDTKSHTKLPGRYKQIYEATKNMDGGPIWWPDVKYQELRSDPLKSAIGARLKYIIKDPPIPPNRNDRANYWKKFYNTDKGKGTIQDYKNRTDPNWSMNTKTKNNTSLASNIGKKHGQQLSGKMS